MRQPRAVGVMRYLLMPEYGRLRLRYGSSPPWTWLRYRVTKGTTVRGLRGLARRARAMQEYGNPVAELADAMVRHVQYGCRVML